LREKSERQKNKTMFRITKKLQLAPKIKEFEVEAPFIAGKAKPGNFVLVRGYTHGERIPLTIADSHPEKGTITLVMQEVGKGTIQLGTLEENDEIHDVVGPLGHEREITGPGKNICCVAGGVGLAPMYPQMKAHHEAGNRVVSIIGARNKSLLFWKERTKAVSDKVLYSTDDGSFGRHGFATQLLQQLIEEGETLDEVIAVGPVPHMKAVTDVCKQYDLPVVVSLNPIMVDGTGMCGGCRVTVGGEIKYACVDGPEFDGAAVDFDELLRRQGTYRDKEMAALAEPASSDRTCALERRFASMRAELEASPGSVPTHSFNHASTLFIAESLARLAAGEDRFDEVATGLTFDAARLEASRCYLCTNPPCVAGCPVEVDSPGFIGAIQHNDLSEAARILKDKNNLPAICGRVCPQETQCEELCILSRFERPVAIGALERFVADWEAQFEPKTPTRAASNGHKIAVIGSGPGGLTCAADLAKMGYAVTIFETFHDTGGVLRYGIPEFRLPKDIVDREVDYVKNLGVKIELNMVIGKVLTLDDLFEKGFEAIFIAVGAGAPVFLDIEGENLVGVYSANELLTRVNLMKANRDDYDTPVYVGRKVTVIGAGNVSMDAARTAKRLGADEVTIVYRRSRAEMPARAAEIAHAEHEGILFQLLTNPTRVLGDDSGHVRGLECIRMELGEPDESGRRRPIPIPDSEFEIECDMVIPAIANKANPLLTSHSPGIQLNKWGNIIADEDTCATSLPGIFAGGDIVIGSATVIEAMGAGKRAARAIDAYIKGK
ncbi:MAG: NADPH-dependent glutamate synthase, partial [Candidatus Hydrogenedentes bacterium]|nr:NADPH-dependent glutamate synthase [Candidatus Hydrogenedentota bacterium]